MKSSNEQKLRQYHDSLFYNTLILLSRIINEVLFFYLSVKLFYFDISGSDVGPIGVN